MESETYSREIWLQNDDGGNLVGPVEERKSPFPFYKIGDLVQDAANPSKTYIVIENIIGSGDVGRAEPRRQTVIVRRN